MLKKNHHDGLQFAMTHFALPRSASNGTFERILMATLSLLESKGLCCMMLEEGVSTEASEPLLMRACGSGGSVPGCACMCLQGPRGFSMSTEFHRIVCYQKRSVLYRPTHFSGRWPAWTSSRSRVGTPMYLIPHCV